MRRSFSNDDLENLRIKRVFLLGENPNDNFTKQNAINNEYKLFNDILQGNFIEAYRNLTYKHIMGHKWASEYCNTAHYIIKMDDDIVVNIERIVDILNKTKLPTNLLAGYVMRNLKPVREPANKWFVTNDEFSPGMYPTFVSGWFYITTPKISSKLVLLSNYEKYFWIDDVYVTGILALHLKITHYDFGKYFTVHSEFLDCCIHDIIQHNIDCDILIGPNGGDPNLFFKFNQAIKQCNYGDRCKRRIKSLNSTCVAERRINLMHGKSTIDKFNLL